MNIRRIECWLTGHIWQNNTGHPTHGYYDRPYPDSYCKRCKLTGQWYSIVNSDTEFSEKDVVFEVPKYNEIYKDV